MGTDLQTQWNAAVDRHPSSFDFYWRAANEFPHPTYRCGSYATYREFGVILVDFLDVTHADLARPIPVELGWSTTFGELLIAVGYMGEMESAGRYAAHSVAKVGD